MASRPPEPIGPVSPESPSSWLHMLRRGDGALQARLEDVYGTDPTRIEDRRGVLVRLLDEFLQAHDDTQPVWIVRAPGRLTTLAMHIDHRGGYLNALCLQQEALLVCRARQDDTIVIRNLQDEFGRRTLRIGQPAPDSPLPDTQAWLSWTNRLAAIRDQRGDRHDWVYKAAAPGAYLQFMYAPDQAARGMDAVLLGDVPVGGGLSSSSSIVVVCMEALLAINGIEIAHDQFAHHCGVAEWFVGTRGGCGDHAAIKYGKQGHLTHMRTEPELLLGGHLQFPSTHRFVVFQSGIVANKTGAAGQKFNEKTATYAIGEMYMRRWLRANHGRFYEDHWAKRDGRPDDKRVFIADVVEHLDDDGLYGLLQAVPEKRTRAALRREWPDDHELLERYFQSHNEPEHYALRDVMAYGLAACSRARRVRDLLGSGDVAGFAQCMNISHNADRVSGITREIAARKHVRDRSLPFHLQSGDYHCSIPEIDHMVDTALSAGAIGAQIAGAGMGGSAITLVPVEAQEQVVDALTSSYRTPTGQPPAHFVAEPCSGSCIL
ncbi:MAG: hypothetical protein JXQ73_15865 [Phycisphaerae bacterium]|nr:hypothetical protein [Phycisphaerae bacterium]